MAFPELKVSILPSSSHCAQSSQSSLDTSVGSSESEIRTVESPALALQTCRVSLQRMKARDMVLLANGFDPATYKERRRITVHCPFCPFTQSAMTNVVRHVIRQHTKETSYKCEDCCKEFQLRYSFLAHERRHKDQQKKFPCSYCSRLLLSKIGLKIHEANHIGQKDYPCTHCDKAFSSPYALVVHTRHHTGERPYQCKYCSHLAFSHTNLQMHMRIHTCEQPYKCSFCPRRFSLNNSRKAHERRLHTFEMPFECPSCDRCFASKADLNAHSWLHRPSHEAPYMCGWCGCGFHRRDAREAHTKTCDPSQVIFCKECERGFNGKPAYMAHVRLMHRHKISVKSEGEAPPTEECDEESALGAATEKVKSEVVIGAT